MFVDDMAYPKPQVRERPFDHFHLMNVAEEEFSRTLVKLIVRASGGGIYQAIPVQ